MPKIDPLAIIVSLGFLSHLIALVYYQRKSGANVASVQTIELLQAQVAAQRDRLSEQNDKILELSKQVATLSEQMKAKDQKIKEFGEIFAQRDPQSAEMTRLAMVAINQVNEMSIVVKDTHTLVVNSNKNVEKLYSIIEKHLKQIETKLKGGV